MQGTDAQPCSSKVRLLKNARSEHDFGRRAQALRQENDVQPRQARGTVAGARFIRFYKEIGVSGGRGSSEPQRVTKEIAGNKNLIKRIEPHHEVSVRFTLLASALGPAHAKQRDDTFCTSRFRMRGAFLLMKSWRSCQKDRPCSAALLRKP